MGMNIFKKSVGLFGVNCYLVQHPETKETVVFDPGGDVPVILAALEKMQATVAAYVLTHGHPDHVSGIGALAAVRPAPVYVGAEDAAWCLSAKNVIPGYYPAPDPLPEGAPVVTPPDDGVDFMLAGARWQVIRTPGHTPGGICWCLMDQNCVFTGDTLFAGSAGRTDLPGGNTDVLMQSLAQLADLPADWRVFPGHNEETTIGQERKTNPFLVG